MSSLEKQCFGEGPEPDGDSHPLTYAILIPDAPLKTPFLPKKQKEKPAG